MRDDLHLKGWTKEEMDRAEKVMERAEQTKHPHTRRLEQSLFIFVNAIAIICSLFFSVRLIPIFVVASNTWAYILTAVFGVFIGGILTIVIKDLHWLESRHHLTTALLMPTVAIVSAFVVVTKTNPIIETLGRTNTHNPFVIGIIYGAAFLLPYLIYLAFRRK